MTTTEKILKTIKENPRITPFEIAKNVGVKTQYVRNILFILTDLKLVKKPVRGVYVITDLGETVLKKVLGCEG